VCLVDEDNDDNVDVEGKDDGDNKENVEAVLEDNHGDDIVVDHNQLQIVTKPTAHRHIPTTIKERRTSLINLYMNGLDLPKYNLLHKAQQSVDADAPGFSEALKNIVIPAKLMYLYQNCLVKPKESFFIAAIAHIQVISEACGLSAEDMIKMRGWVFLQKKR
jgi:hypothetical protein